MSEEKVHIVPHFFVGHIADCCCMCGEKMNCQFAMTMDDIAKCSDAAAGFKVNECFVQFMQFLIREGWEYQDKGDRLYCPTCLPLAKFRRSLERHVETERAVAIKHFDHRRCPNCNLDRDYVRDQIRKAKETRDILGKGTKGGLDKC